jgi:hypothetical protein
MKHMAKLNINDYGDDTDECNKYKNDTMMMSRQKSKLYYDRRSVGQSVLVTGTHLGPATNFSAFFNYIVTVNVFVHVRRFL